MATTVYQREISTGHLTDIRKDWGAYTGLVLLWARQFFHDLFKSSMTYGKLPLLKNVQYYPSYGISDLTQVNRHKLWHPLKCVLFALFLPEKKKNSRRHQWFPRAEMTRETSLEILRWQRVTIQIRVVLLIGWSKFPMRHDQSEALHRTEYIRSDASSEWNFCARFSDVTSQGNPWWRHRLSSVFRLALFDYLSLSNFVFELTYALKRWGCLS